MRLEDARLALEPRTVGGAIDLAILFYRRHWVRLLLLTLLVGSPPVAFAAWRARSGDGWLWAFLLFFYGSSFLGAAVVAGAGHHVFGEPFTLANVLRHLRRRVGALLLFLPLSRTLMGGIGVLCWGVLWVPFAARYGFLSEVLLLEQLRGLRIGKRLEEIVGNTFIETCGRYLAIVGFAFCLVVSLFLLLDLGSQLLFGIPIFLSRVSWALAFEDVFNLLSYDPLLVASLAATFWLVYPLARLAWFFCYLDARIRKEGWDLEIAFRVEARRIA